ncbi:MAG: CDF family Co(II)/Ni(II) efflux transporter DmeF [Steroidobacteraceae bacterium]
MSQIPASRRCPQSWLGEHHDHHARRTQWVVALTLVMMVAEILGGAYYGSMALVADGWHMATHAAALGIAALAYRYARRHAQDPRFAFGTGKVGELAGFASAVSLAIVALLIGAESLQRLLHPQRIDFLQAGAIAVVGLIVNLVSAALLRHDHADGDDDDHRDHTQAAHHDTNLRAAYLHVLADALTSVLAIIGLLAGRYMGWIWMDAGAGLLGAAVIAHWSLGLARNAGRSLLDSQDDSALEQAVRARLQTVSGNAEITDLHLWRLGPGQFGLIVTLRGPGVDTPDQYRSQLATLPQLRHITVETNTA